MSTSAQTPKILVRERIDWLDGDVKHSMLHRLWEGGLELYLSGSSDDQNRQWRDASKEDWEALVQSGKLPVGTYEGSEWGDGLPDAPSHHVAFWERLASSSPGG